MFVKLEQTWDRRYSKGLGLTFLVDACLMMTPERLKLCFHYPVRELTGGTSGERQALIAFALNSLRASQSRRTDPIAPST